MTDTFFNHITVPLQIGRVHLRVRDLEKVSDFYQRVIGLAVIDKSAVEVNLGAGSVPLLKLVADPSALPRKPRDAGLFHAAFLLASRADLSHWLVHASKLGVKLQGAADHLVSEAIYLSDPEGNGIEVYADRPLSHWRDADGHIRMASEPLDIPDLLGAGTGTWSGCPADAIIGHVHLQVGDTDGADSFYSNVLGLDIASRYPGASFFGSGGYHHHIAANIWNSRGAGPRPQRTAGLELVEVIVRDPVSLAAILERAQTVGVHVISDGAASVLRDPWGTAIALRA